MITQPQPQPQPSLLQSQISVLLLISLSILVCPLTLSFSLSSYLYYLYHHHHPSKPRSSSSRTPQTILITGSRGLKSLSLARCFSPDHQTILADSKPWSILSPVRFSNSVTYHEFLPSSHQSPEGYQDKILELIETYSIDHWIPCSGPTNTILDCEIGERLRLKLGRKCWAWTPSVRLSRALHEKDQFMLMCARLGMDVPHSSGILKSVEEAMKFLYDPVSKTQTTHQDWSYILKPIDFVNGSARTDLTRLPLSTRALTQSHLRSKFKTHPLQPTHDQHQEEDQAYVLQRFIKGQEFCTHASVYDNQVKSFVVSKGSDMVMRYEDLRRIPNFQHISNLAEVWTKTFLKSLQEIDGDRYDGHFSLDFIFEEVDQKLYPIECNPVRVFFFILLNQNSPRQSSSFQH